MAPNRKCPGEELETRSIPRLLSTLCGMGVEILVRDSELEHRFMDPITIFDRVPMTNEERIAEIQRSQPFIEMLERKGEIIQHWDASPGNSILDYPDRYRIFTCDFQELFIDQHKKRGRIMELVPHSREERWLPE